MCVYERGMKEVCIRDFIAEKLYFKAKNSFINHFSYPRDVTPTLPLITLNY